MLELYRTFLNIPKRHCRYYCEFVHLFAKPHIQNWKNKFIGGNVKDIDFSLKCITARVLNIEFNKLCEYKEIDFTIDQKLEFDRLCECRLAGMPLQYVLGNWDFRELKLKMIPPVFIPRPETEGLVDIILKYIDIKKPLRILEIGSGSGAISISLLKELPKAECFAIDRSKIACQATLENSQLNNVLNRINVFNYNLKQSNLPECIQGTFDIIVSNPPYIKTAELRKLSDEIKLYEDLRALDGGKDGLDVIRIICDIAFKYLNKNCWLWLEVDSSHPKYIQELIKNHYENTLYLNRVFKDIFGRDRFVQIAKTK